MAVFLRKDSNNEWRIWVNFVIIWGDWHECVNSRIIRCCRVLSYQLISCYACHCFEIEQVHLHFNCSTMGFTNCCIIYENPEDIQARFSIPWCRILSEKIWSKKNCWTVLTARSPESPDDQMTRNHGVTDSHRWADLTSKGCLDNCEKSSVLEQLDQLDIHCGVRLRNKHFVHFVFINIFLQLW